MSTKKAGTILSKSFYAVAFTRRFCTIVTASKNKIIAVLLSKLDFYRPRYHREQMIGNMRRYMNRMNLPMAN